MKVVRENYKIVNLIKTSFIVPHANGPQMMSGTPQSGSLVNQTKNTTGDRTIY